MKSAINQQILGYSYSQFGVKIFVHSFPHKYIAWKLNLTNECIWSPKLSQELAIHANMIITLYHIVIVGKKSYESIYKGLMGYCWMIDPITFLHHSVTELVNSYGSTQFCIAGKFKGSIFEGFEAFCSTLKFILEHFVKVKNWRMQFSNHFI